MKKRIYWIDVVKYICIMFVMLSHFEICPDYLRDFFDPFFLAGFFFCSGYCYKHNENFKEFFIKKVKQLFVPWLIYSNLNIIISNIKSIKVHENSFLTEVFRNLLQIRYYDERLWFIPALFTAFIPFYFLIKNYNNKKNKTNNILLLCVVLCFIRQVYKNFMDPSLLPWNLTSLPWHIDYIPTALFFMTVGYLFKERWETYFDNKSTLSNRVILSIIYLFIVYLPYLITLPMDNYIFDFFYDHIRHVLGIFFLVSWCKEINVNKYISYVGSNTLLYFCIHNKFVTLYEAVLKKYFKDIYAALSNNVLLITIYVVISTIIISLVLIVPTVFVNKYLPFTVGKKKRNIETTLVKG